MHAVFFQSDTMRPEGIEDQTIHLFDEEPDAVRFMCATLVEIGMVEPLQAGTPLELLDEALSEAQMGFATSEYFHVYPVVDHRRAEHDTES